jgi:GT2 family glycosyltransferase
MDDLKTVSGLRLTVVVVLYNLELKQSETLSSLKGQLSHNLDINLVLWDNSPIPVNDVNEYADYLPFSIKYYHTPENLSLAKVYNRVIGAETFDYLLLLDQDTKLPDTYLSLIEQLTTSNPTLNLFLPVVKNGNRMVSPGSFQYFKGTHLSAIQPGICSSKNLLAIGSGMTISNNVFSKLNLRFDERLSFYGIDSRFMLDYARVQDLLYVMPVTLNHDSALWSNPSAEVLLPRFRNLRKAWSLLLSDKPAVRLLNRFYYAIKSVMFCIKFRDPRFLR